MGSPGTFVGIDDQSVKLAGKFRLEAVPQRLDFGGRGGRLGHGFLQGGDKTGGQRGIFRAGTQAALLETAPELGS